MTRSAMIAALALMGLSACVAEQEVSGSAAFQESCAACHGADARGGGPLADGLPIPPPDLTGMSGANGGIFPRDYIMSTIDGYSRGVHFSEAMPEFGAGDLGPTVIVEDVEGIGTPVPVRLLALADYLESIQR